jgi:integrase
MGEANPAKMQRKDVIRLRDANADKAYFANYSLRVLRVLMEHCVDLGWRESNPARGVPELKTQKRERDPWPQELLDAYRAACPLGTRERLIMELCVGTGQRIGDVLNMRWSNIEDGSVWLRQSKTSKELWVPILPELQAALDAASRHSVFILTNERGVDRWSYRGASAAVLKVRERIGASATISIHGATTPPVSCWRRAAAMISLPPSPGRVRRWCSTTPRRSASGSEPCKRRRCEPDRSGPSSDR